MASRLFGVQPVISPVVLSKEMSARPPLVALYPEASSKVMYVPPTFTSRS